MLFLCILCIDLELGDNEAIESKYLYQDIKSFRTIHKVEFGKKGLKHHLSDHGITVIIPEDAVDREAVLYIGVYYVDFLKTTDLCQVYSGLIAPFLYRNM